MTKDLSESVQSEILHMVTQQPQESALSLMSQELMRKMQAASIKGPSLEEVKSRHVPHGKLVGCSYYASSQGMMYNSNTLLNISVALIDGVQKISYTEKQAFQPTKVTVYQPKQDVLATVQDLVEHENLAAWSALEYHDPFKCTDYSSSASITLTFDDSSVDGRTRTSVSINVDAACQHCGGDVIQEFRNLLETVVLDAEVLSQNVSEAPAYGLGMMLYQPQPAEVPDSKHPDGAWECPNCGNASNTGKFCTECGTRWEPPLPEPPTGAWQCQNCGYAFNTGKFCTECGTKNKP